MRTRMVGVRKAAKRCRQPYRESYGSEVLAHEIDNGVLASGAYAFHWRREGGVLTL
jgi:hypothetical protein